MELTNQIIFLGGILAAYIVRIVRTPVVGDRVRIGHVEIVVREMEGDRITRIGLKLGD